MLQTDPSKQCTVCLAWKDPSEFYPRYGYCKPCTMQKQKAYLSGLTEDVKKARQQQAQQHANRRNKENPHGGRARAKRHYQKHRDRLKAESLARYHAHPEPHNAQHQAWLKANPDKVQEYEKRAKRNHELKKLTKQRYVKTHPERRRASLNASNHRRRAQKHGAMSEKFLSLEIYERDDWTCHICGEKVTPESASIDHLIPISQGGAHTRRNVATAHRGCNSRRHVKSIHAQLRLF
jgi:5-methylcytosine-specific restriction endonuclease McrA